MKLTHIYKIKPSSEQVTMMETWLEMLRRHYNYALSQRFDLLRRTRCQIDRCSLISEPIGDIPSRFPSYNVQAGELKQTKELFPAYKEIHAEVQQQNLKRLDKSWDRWIKPDKSGKTGGRQKHLARQQKQLARKMAGSANSQKQRQKISRIHLRIGLLIN
jgi:putative transposase